MIRFLFVSLFFISCSSTRNLPTVSEVDLEKYSGLWYEYARLPNRFEKGLDCVTAQYTIKENGKIEVLNSGRKFDKNNEISSVKGSAKIPDAQYPGKLKVTFFWPFAGDYYIIALDKDYSYALVGDPSRKFLWVLSRQKSLNSEIYNDLMNIAESLGFDTNAVIKINQDCDHH